MKIAFLTSIVFISFVMEIGAAQPANTALVAASSRTGTPARTRGVQSTWPHDVSDLKPDPNAIWGQLENGLRYVIVPQKTAGRPSLRLYMRVGSLMETDAEQGIAHFLEHMAFNGTKHFPAGEIWNELQRLGMNVGADANAATMLDKTVYQLDLPRASEQFTSEGLTLFRDILDGMLLDSNQIDRERRVVLSELRASDSVALHRQVAALRFMLPDTLAWQRMPIGKIETIQGMSRQRFVDFYETWYTPGRATIVAAGPFDVKLLERLIREKFQDSRARRGERPDRQLGEVKLGAGIAARLAVEKESPSATIIMSAVVPAAQAPDTTESQRDNLLGAMANMMLK